MIMDTSKLEPVFEQLVEKVNANMNPTDCAKLLYVIGEIRKGKAQQAEKDRKAMEATKEFQALSTSLKELAMVNIKETEISRALREITKQTAEETGETKFVGSYTRNKQILNYDPVKARDWIIEHNFLEALLIKPEEFVELAKFAIKHHFSRAFYANQTEFEKLAKSNKPEFVTFIDEVQPCLVSDLEKVFSDLTEDDISNMLVE